MNSAQRLYLFFSLLILASCTRSGSPGFENGIWRATLKTETGAEIPFNFEVKDSAEQKIIYLINGQERILVTDITRQDDSLIIRMPFFDSEIRAQFEGKNLSGNWIKHLASTSPTMKFNASPGQEWRFFKARGKEKVNISGRWSVLFTTPDSNDSTIAVGEFSQSGSRVSGTFMTSTGDYRYLDGTISDKSLYLSSFDGGGAYLFTGRLLNDTTIVDGKFYSGYSYLSKWVAGRDPKAALPDSYSLTALKPGYRNIEFTFDNLQGESVSLDDPKFRGKVVLVQFFGSWCPNCMDETAFLAPYYDKNKDRELEIVALAYERTADQERSRRSVTKLKERLKVNYEILLTGYTNDPQDVARSLPMLKNFIAFPTLIIIDKKGIVRKIHTGFNGPGTGKHYDNFIVEFEKTMNHLLAE